MNPRTLTTLTCPVCGDTFNADQEFIARIILDEHTHREHPAGERPAALEGEQS